MNHHSPSARTCPIYKLHLYLMQSGLMSWPVLHCSKNSQDLSISLISGRKGFSCFLFGSHHWPTVEVHFLRNSILYTLIQSFTVPLTKYLTKVLDSSTNSVGAPIFCYLRFLFHGKGKVRPSLCRFDFLNFLSSFQIALGTVPANEPVWSKGELTRGHRWWKRAITKGSQFRAYVCEAAHFTEKICGWTFLWLH